MSLPYPVTTTAEATFTDERFPGAVFVVVKGCAGQHGTTKRRNEIAHAHDYADGSEYGLVCIQDNRMPVSDETLAHEYAHLLNANADAHGPKWRAHLTALGYPEEAARYANRKRTRVTAVYENGDLRNWGLVPLFQYEHTIAGNGRIDGEDIIAAMQKVDSHGKIVKVFKGVLDEDPEEQWVYIERTLVVSKTVKIKVAKRYYSGDPHTYGHIMADRVEWIDGDYEWTEPIVTE